MSTRGLIHIYNVNEGQSISDAAKKMPLVTLYNHSDSYPEGLGRELVEFLTGFTVVNGLSLDQSGKIANGTGCLAAQLVKKFKREAGGLYIYPSGSKNCGEDFVYSIFVEVNLSFKKPIVLRISVPTYSKDYSKITGSKILFEGPVHIAENWIEEYAN